jgi:hypothetical protein
MKESVQQKNKNYHAKNGDEIRRRRREIWQLKNPLKEPKPKRSIEEIKERQKKYYRENKERYMEYMKKYYQDNKDKINARVRKWILENKERHKINRKTYAEKNKKILSVRQSERMKKLFAENPEKVREYRRAKKKRMKARDPKAWNEKACRYNRPLQKKMADELSDAYVRQKLACPSGSSPRRISAKDIPQGLVEAKRLQIMILRSLRNEKC